jgi:hypothetical protein
LIVRAALTALACLLAGFANGEDASDPFSAARESEAGEGVALHRTPDHLQPVDPYPQDYSIAYTKRLAKYLDLSAPYLARMSVRPSFDAEYLMRINGPPEDDTEYASKEFFVSCTVSDKSIWYAMPENNDEKKQKPINPESSKAPLPSETARKVCGLWDEMIFRTRYSRELNSGLDGTTIEFASPRGHGEAWTPSAGTSPALLWDLGEKLVAYCKAPADDREKLLKTVNESAGKLESYLKQRPEKDGVIPVAPRAELKPDGDQRSETKPEEPSK